MAKNSVSGRGRGFPSTSRRASSSSPGVTFAQSIASRSRRLARADPSVSLPVSIRGDVDVAGHPRTESTRRSVERVERGTPRAPRRNARARVRPQPRDAADHERQCRKVPTAPFPRRNDGTRGIRCELERFSFHPSSSSLASKPKISHLPPPIYPRDPHPLPRRFRADRRAARVTSRRVSPMKPSPSAPRARRTT